MWKGSEAISLSFPSVPSHQLSANVSGPAETRPIYLNECQSCPALLLCRYHHLMISTPRLHRAHRYQQCQRETVGPAAGQAALFLSPPPPPPICRRRIKGGRTPASARAPAAAPAAHLPAELRRHRNLCAPAGRGAMVPPPPRPSRAYRRR
jgi:hypothetical protein